MVILNLFSDNYYDVGAKFRLTEIPYLQRETIASELTPSTLAMAAGRRGNEGREDKEGRK